MIDPREQMSEETRELLGELTREDIETLRTGLPIIRAVIGFGRVSKWLIITAAGVFFGVVMLWEAILKMLGWLWPPPPLH